MDGANSVELLAGNVVNANPDVAEKWIKQGLAMEDKSMDGGIEIKDAIIERPITRAPVRRKKRK